MDKSNLVLLSLAVLLLNMGNGIGFNLNYFVVS